MTAGLAAAGLFIASAFLPEPFVGTWRVPASQNNGIQLTLNFWQSGDADGFVIVDPRDQKNKSKRAWRGSWAVSTNHQGEMVLKLEGVSEVFGKDDGQQTAFLDLFSCVVSGLSDSQFTCSTEQLETVFYASGR